MLHPALALAGLAAGLIPLIIHLINRRRHRRVDWAAMAFLLTAARRRSRRMRLEQWLLFAVRVLAIVLLGLAVARPYVAASRFLPVGQSHFHRVILLDNSGSMGASAGDEDPEAARAQARGSVYDQARAVVVRLVDSFPKTDEVSIVSLAAPASAVIDYPSLDRRRIRQALANLPLTQRATDLTGGLDRALDLLKKSSAAPDNRCVYVISDMAGGAWSGGGGASDGAKDRSLAVAARKVAEQAALVLVPLGDPLATNAGISRLVLGSTVTAAQVPLRVTAEVINYGVTDVHEAVLQIHRDQRVERRIALPTLEPGQVETVTFSMVFDSAGSHAVRACLDAGPADRLALDNERLLALEVSESWDVLVVDGAPGRTRLSGQAGYLLTALHPWPASRSDSIVSPKAISDLELGGEILSAYQVVVLCNVERIDEDIWQRLRTYVDCGGGLLVFAGEAVNLDHYNRFGYAAGQGVLPGKLKPAQGGLGRTGSTHTELGFAKDEIAHPVLADFEGLATSGVFMARVERRMPIELNDPAVEVVLRYTDQEPAIVIRQRGAGRSCFVTTSADMAWNNLPAKGDYVSLMMNLVAYLAQPQAHSRNVEVGRPILRRLAPGESSMPLRVRLPSGDTADASLAVVPPRRAAEEGGFELRYADTERAGLYATLVGSAAQAVAVNPPPAESDLKPVDQSALAKTLDVPFAYVSDAEELTAQAGAPGAYELGPGIAHAVLILLLCETWLAMRHGPGRGQERAGRKPSSRPGLRTQHSRLSTQHSALSTQDSGLLAHDA